MSVLGLTVETAELEGAWDAFVVTAAGEVDLYTAPEVEQALEGVLGVGGTSVVLDLTEVGFIDSTLLSILLRYHGRLVGLGGGLVIVTDDRRILRAFEVTGLDQFFTIEPGLGEAIRSVAEGSNGRPAGA